MTVITLMTDFGLKDGNVGVMKGVIWSIAPEAQIADLSHQIQPQNIQEAALILFRSVPYFPAGTIHVVVVDPGVGTSRRPIAARLGSQYFVLPDNGLITLVLRQAEAKKGAIEFVHLDQPAYWLPKVSHVFHGRDIFAPVAAYLAHAVSLQALGTPVSDPVRIPFPVPQRTSRGWKAEIVHIDHFGNISTSLSKADLGEPADIEVCLKGVSIRGMVRTFGERPPGKLVALYSSSDFLIICEVNGSAAERLDAQVGDPVEVFQHPLQASGV